METYGIFTGMKWIKGMFTTEPLVPRTTRNRFSACPIKQEWALQRKAGCLWDHLCNLSCKSETKDNRTEVLPGSNFCHAFLTISFIPFIPVPNPFSASRRLREKSDFHPNKEEPEFFRESFGFLAVNSSARRLTAAMMAR